MQYDQDCGYLHRPTERSAGGRLMLRVDRDNALEGSRISCYIPSVNTVIVHIVIYMLLIVPYANKELWVSTTEDSFLELIFHFST